MRWDEIVLVPQSKEEKLHRSEYFRIGINIKKVARLPIQHGTLAGDPL